MSAMIPDNNLHTNLPKQRGAVLMVMLVLVVVGSAAFLVSALSNRGLQTERDNVTSNALAQAKEALIGYAANNNPPGQLPCPEQISLIGSPTEGSADGSCSNSLPSIGRLPWRTLGVGPIRDGHGELLWYVLSPGFRNAPINSDTSAQLAVDGIPNRAVAIIFSAGPPINGQAHPPLAPATAPDITQYLELSNNVVNSTSFVSSGTPTTFNDRLLPVTPNDLFRVVEKRVVKEVVKALNEYYCGIGNVNPAGGCIGSGGNRYYPHPAKFNDNNCLGSSAIASGCDSDLTINNGRIPANPVIPWDNAFSILRGTTAFGGNWFQSNSWREVFFYAVSTLCSDGTSNCTNGNLTLNNSTGTPLTNRKVIVIATGSVLTITTPAQVRSNTGHQKNINNYLEDENLAPLDDVYTNNAINPFNDIATSIP